jgi:hypothetical protein
VKEGIRSKSIKGENALKNIHKLMNQINEKECVDRDIVWL